MTSSARPLSAMAVAGLVLGILALLTSFLPVVNNGSFLLALLGIVFSVVGIVGAARGKRSGKGLAIAAAVLNVLSLAIVLVTQSMYGAALDEVSKNLQGPDVAATSVSGTSALNGDSAAQATDLALGTTITLDSGLTVSVDELRTDLVSYDGSPMTAVRVSYVNGGTAPESFSNLIDWKGEDARGAQRNATIYIGEGDAGEALDSGSLAAGGSASGWIYFDGTLSKVLYYANVFDDSATASWLVG